MRDLIGRSSVRNTIFMMRQVERQKTVRIVEGDSDSRAFGKFVRTSHCRIFSPGYPGGKEYALALFDDLKQKKLPGLAALVDADCDRFWGRSRRHIDICWTSAADKEVMIVQSPAFAIFVTAHHFNGDADAFRLQVLRAAFPLGCLRIMSRRDRWGLDFKSVECGRFVDAISLACDERACCNEVLAQNLNAPASESDLVDAIDTVRGRRPDLQDVVCGHDVAAILSFASGSKLAGPLTTNQVEQQLAECFELSHFIQTSTFDEWVQWERRNAPFVINI
jgi:hypothetical protein